ncbi:hypothetical protein FZC79_09165 [Rossellomorea vietnamensis]|uniref:Uncharacterized protein n=2 Tax=Rossellomorea TaxID=2837508 RepID=A0A5D4NM40_9BACI|nr:MULTISPECIES: hypothetical protein [Rossellomorea]TYR75780.1 hypothetical protein FZC79_09165 [Rossellomorea vietnamensis]TYS14979.1 hypothetical protein FZC78_16920 [Rossellomorea vietnamensis]TYS80989.1 hypothetical protein FZC80_07760 [Rossellomorea aquimaris]
MLSRIKWLSFSIEAFLALPIFGSVASELMPFYLCFIAVWHACVLMVSKSEDQPVLGSAFGIIASFLNFFPYVRIAAHAVTAFILYFEIKKAPGME